MLMDASLVENMSTGQPLCCGCM